MKLKFFSRTDDLIKSGERFRDLIKLMCKPEIGFVKTILINTFAISILGLAIPLGIQQVINNIGVRTMVQPLVFLCLILLFILLFSGALQAIQTYVVEILKRRLFVRYGYVISERLNHYQNHIFKKADAPALINRYFDITIMQAQMVTFFVDGFGFFIMFIIGFGLLIFYHPYFLLFAILMVVFLIVNWMLFGPDGVRAGSPEADGKYNVVGWIEEISRVRNLFMSESGRTFSNKKMTDFLNKWLYKRKTLFNYQFNQHMGLQLFSVLTNVLLLFLGGYMVLSEELSIGQLVAATLVVSNIISNLGRLQNFFFSIYDYSTSLDMIARFYDYPIESQRESVLEPKKFDFQFDNVTYKPNYKFNFNFKEGTKNFIMVKSFSSMELIYESLVGLNVPESGFVKIDNNELVDIDIAKLRDSVQIIRYDQFFAGTVLENLVGMLHKQIPITEIHEVLDRVGLLENILALPDQLQTKIQPNGFPFSLSQLLTLQFARFILSKPQILIITPDFERISTFKRKLILHEILNINHGSMIMFFSQRLYRGVFDRYMILERQSLKQVTDVNEMQKEIEVYV